MVSEGLPQIAQICAELFCENLRENNQNLIQCV